VVSPPYNRSIRLLRLRTLRILRLLYEASSPSCGKGGNSIMGARSPAPRAIIFWGEDLRESGNGIVGTGGISGEMLCRVGGRDSTFELRRNFWNGEVLLMAGAVIGVIGVLGVRGVGGKFAGFPLTRESHFLVEGVIAILARESFCEMDRRRLCGGDLIMGEAALLVAFS
jgi:hypothetical protein